MDEAALKKKVRQHAETARLLGVDFVPRYRPRGAGAVAAEEAPLADEAVSAAAAPQPSIEAAPSAARAPKAPAAPAPIPTPAKGPEVPALGLEAIRAEKSKRLDELRLRYEKEAPHRNFVTAHTKIVWGDGDPHARLVFVGEAPGEEEDRQGVPFVGRSGELLNKAIVALGLKREDVYTCNVLKTRPPDNAKPTDREIEACYPYLLAQLAIVAPRAIVVLGASALKALLKSDDSITRVRGSWKELALPDGTRVPVMPTFHPAYVLRNYTPEIRGQVWSDIKKAAERSSDRSATL